MSSNLISFAGAVVAAATLLPAAPAQVMPDDSVLWPADVDSGWVCAGGPAREVVFSTVLAAPDASWVRLRFEDASLPGTGETRAQLRITSLADGAQQTLNATTLAQWSDSSAYFNGDAVELEILSTVEAGPARIRVTGILAGPAAALGNRNVCGGIDDRIPSSDPRAGRLEPGTCTGWLIDDACGCFLTAGHCMTGSQIGRIVEFNVPLSTPDGGIQHPPPQDQYAIDPESVQTNFGQGIGDDWAAFGCFPNADTGLTAREAQGQTYVLSEEPGATPIGSQLRITGYGSVGILGGSPDVPLEWHLVQKTSTGPLAVLSGSTIQYLVDSTGGNSGSPVLDETTGLALAIHTHGACATEGGLNSGTTVAHPEVRAALAAPLGVCAGPPLPTTDETAKLTAPDAAVGDRFGTGVAIDGDVLLVGSPRDDDRGSNSGAVRVYRRTGAAWVSEAKLLATGGGAGDQLGAAVAIRGDLAAASAAGSAGTLTTAFPTRVYVFRRQSAGQIWEQEASLAPSEAARDDWFGLDLALSESTLIVGAPRDASGQDGVNTGAIWLYDCSGDAWGAGQRLAPADAAGFDQFGFSVDMDADAAAAGAPFDDDAGSSSGSAYVFRRGQGGWAEEAKLVAPDAAAGDQFGMAIAIGGDVVAVGCPRSSSAGAGAGAVYVFRRGETGWGFEAKLTAPDATPGDEFGSSIALDGQTLVIGAIDDSIVGVRSGSAYVFRTDGGGAGGWTFVEKLAASDRADADQFGASIAAAGGRIVTGSPQDDDAGSSSGSAYVFEPAQAACPADQDADDDADVFDLLAYLDLWFDGAGAADLEGDLDIDVFDLLLYLDSWFQGC